MKCDKAICMVWAKFCTMPLTYWWLRAGEHDPAYFCRCDIDSIQWVATCRGTRSRLFLSMWHRFHPMGGNVPGNTIPPIFVDVISIQCRIDSFCSVLAQLLVRKLHLLHRRYYRKNTISLRTWIVCAQHDEVIKWKHFLRYWPFARGIHQSPVNSWRKANDAEIWCLLSSMPE